MPSSCCQIRTMVHPRAFRTRLTNRSRALFRSNLACQNPPLLTGTEPCSRHPCQKQPSTKIATLESGNTKSGLPKTGRCRRQPVTLLRRRSFTSASSVRLLPRPRTRDIISDRFDRENTSTILSPIPRAGFLQPNRPSHAAQSDEVAFEASRRCPQLRPLAQGQSTLSRPRLP